MNHNTSFSKALLKAFAVFCFCICTQIITSAALSPQAHAQQRTVKIQEIRVDGTERIEPSTVVTYLGLSAGERVDQGALDDALKNLFVTGLFADVTLKLDDSVLNVNVIENPVVNRIAFEGNDKINDDELLAEIQLSPRQVFTRPKVQTDVNRLSQIYQSSGRFSSNIEPKVIKLPQNRVDLVFEIQEGPVTKIKSVRFVGNKKYSDDKLRSEIVTTEDVWYRFLSANDKYDPDRIEFDKELLRRFYLSQGYADFRIVSAVSELSKNREHFFVTFTVDEGQRYKVGDITVTSEINDIKQDDVIEHVVLEKGDWYNADEVGTSVDAITDALGDQQYAFVNIRPQVRRNLEDRTVHVNLNIEETSQVFVERIDIHGNVRTLDRVIRREMEVVESDPYNKTLIARSERNIRNLGYFENVTVKNARGSSPDKSVIDIEVAEKSTGELSLGAGFSTTDGPLADIRVTERNFLGKGQTLSTAATIAGERTEFDIGFTEPYFLDRDFSAGFDLFHMTRDLQDESSFNQRKTGGALRFGYPLSENWRQTLRYRVERNDITDVETGASLFIREQEGQRVTSAISQRISYDNRDSRLFPTNGLMGWFDTELAGLGGDAKYISGRLGASYYYPVLDKVVFNILSEVGGLTSYGDSDIKINERYFLGGQNLRGFEDAGVGPRDEATEDSLGGNYFFRSSAELSFPLGLPEEMGIKGHTFTDIGSLWGLDDADRFNIDDKSSLRGTAGVGVSWRSPLGPIRLDFAVPYMSEEFDKEEVFRFNFGTRF